MGPVIHLTKGEAHGPVVVADDDVISNLDMSARGRS